MKRSEVRHRVQNISLGFIAGYVDTLGFVALFGLFIGHITGNFVLIGAELSRPQSGPVLLKFLAFPSFIFGVAFARSEEHTSELQSLMRISYAVFCLKQKKTR